MKLNLCRVLLLVAIVHMVNSCSSENSELQDSKTPSLEVMNYTYTSFELETMALINDYRISVGLNALKIINHISYKSEEHDKYMIANNVLSHDDFIARSQNIINVLGASRVHENVACKFNSPRTVFEAWMKSPGHKENIIGDFTHFGISIRENPVDGIKYITNIFVKI
jgi:uncharacterized protein YkwD